MMGKEEIGKKVLEILEDHSLEETLLSEEKLINQGFDSLDKIEVCMDIEKAFGITIDDNFLYSSQVDDMTAKEVVDYVTSQVLVAQAPDNEN